VLLLNELALGSAAVLAIVLAARRPEGLASLGLVSAFPPHAWLLIPLAYVPLFLVDVGLGAGWSIVCRARGWEAEQEIMRLLLELRGNKLVVAGAVAVLLGPLVEELLFRGFLQSALAQVLGDRGAILVGSGIFAGLHGVAGLPILFTLSLFLGWLQARTRSIWVPWSAHALHNGVALCLALAMSPG